MKEIKINMDKLNRNWDPRNEVIYSQNHHKTVWYFDDDFCWRQCSAETAIKKGIKNIKCSTKKDGTRYYYTINEIWNLFSYDQNWILCIRIVKAMKEGDHISELVRLCETMTYYMRTPEDSKRVQWWRNEMHKQDLAEMSEVERAITKIEKPRIYKERGNERDKTFDFIQIYMSIKTYMPEKMKFVKEHKKELIQMAYNAIEEDKNFQKYEVPINFLKITRMTLLRDSQIEYLFELKIPGRKTT